MDNTLIKLIPNFETNITGKIYQSQFLFITDKNNHCIRKVDLGKAEVSTFAGICTSPGFKDGPTGTNLFSSPDGLGIDDVGNLYVYDSGNKYMRYITTDGFVNTLINGACFEYLMNKIVENVYGVGSQYLLCLK